MVFLRKCGLQPFPDLFDALSSFTSPPNENSSSNSTKKPSRNENSCRPGRALESMAIGEYRESWLCARSLPIQAPHSSAEENLRARKLANERMNHTSDLLGR